jgi:hypothetical protein
VRPSGTARFMILLRVPPEVLVKLELFYDRRRCLISDAFVVRILVR